MLGLKNKFWSVTVMFALVTTPAIAASTPKVGQTCPKKGVIKEVGKNRLICVSKNSKLKWEKVASKVVVIPSSQVTPVATPSSTDPVDDGYYGIDEISLEIYKKIDKYSLELYSQLSDNDNDIIIEAENSSDSFIPDVTAVTKLGFKILRVIYPSLPSQNVYLYENVSWVESKVMPICPKTMEWVRQYGQANAGCGVLFVADLPIFHKFGFDVAKNIATHEMFHNVTIKAEEEIPVNQRKYEQVASWFTEGMAQISSGITRALYADIKNPHYGNLNWPDNSSQEICANALSLWKTEAINANHAATNNCEYGLGRFMAEILVARSGSLKPAIDMHRDRVQGVPFYDSLEKRFGVTKAEFIKLVDERLAAMGWT